MFHFILFGEFFTGDNISTDKYTGKSISIQNKNHKHTKPLHFEHPNNNGDSLRKFALLQCNVSIIKL